MNEIYNLNLNDTTIETMLELNPDLKNISNREIKEKKLILEGINCNETEIRNIISSNPNFLNRSNEEIINFIKELLEIGFTNINILLDSNPYILNLEIFEIKNYINKKISNGELIDDIIDYLEANTYEFNEM